MEDSFSPLHALRTAFPPRNGGGKVLIGEFTYGVPVVKSWGEESVLTIGKFCSIAENVTVFLGGEHRTDWVTTYPFNALAPEFAHMTGHPRSKGDVRIGNDVWIATGATILSGVTVGDGAAIGAGALVSRDVPPYAIAAGNPARTVRHRFSEEVVRKLLRIRWWDWDLARIEQAVPLLQSADMDAFLRYAEAE